MKNIGTSFPQITLIPSNDKNIIIKNDCCSWNKVGNNILFAEMAKLFFSNDIELPAFGQPSCLNYQSFFNAFSKKTFKMTTISETTTIFANDRKCLNKKTQI